MTTQRDFSSKYTNANLPSDAASYDAATFSGLVQELEDVDNGSISKVAPAIIAVMLCAQKRGDIVPLLFRDLTKGKTDDEKKELFLLLKHGITLTWPFFGLPNSMPACLGLVNELRQANITVSSETGRPLFGEIDWFAKGLETNRAIYRAAGNSEVGRMIAESFPEISYVANAAIFGFLIGGSENVQSLPLTEIIVASAITGTGATRQARSHLKGSMGLGISPAAVQSVLDAAKQVAAWNGTKLPREINVSELAYEVKATLEQLQAS